MLLLRKLGLLRSDHEVPELVSDRVWTHALESTTWRLCPQPVRFTDPKRETVPPAPNVAHRYTAAV